MIRVGIEAMNVFGGTTYFDVMQYLIELKQAMDQYETLLKGSGAVKFGIRNIRLNFQLFLEAMASYHGKQRLDLEIREFHRKYRWVS